MRAHRGRRASGRSARRPRVEGTPRTGLEFCPPFNTAAPISYSDFRTGLTYFEVYHFIYSRKWKRRHGVLGKWREIKQAMYARYLNELGMTD